MKQPFFSVVIPVYNREELISETISSVLNQLYSNFELILIDDGSTDKSANVIKNFQDSRIKYCYIKNSERGAARNFGIQSSTGEFVVLLDSDDIMLEDHLATLYEHCRKTKLDFVATKYFCKTETGREEYYSEIAALEEGFHTFHTFIRGNMLACNFAFRISNRSLRMFQESRELSIMEDWIFLLENLFDQRIFIINKYTVIQKYHAKRSMQENNLRVIERKQNALKWLNDHINFTSSEQKILKAHAFYFIAIHYYLDAKRLRAFEFLFLSVINGKIDLSVFSLLLKSIVGRKIIDIIVRIKYR